MGVVCMTSAGIGRRRFDMGTKTQRKIRISARLWVNSLDARDACKRALESSWCRRGKPNSPPTVAAQTTNRRWHRSIYR
jgi:hypothetical protein